MIGHNNLQDLTILCDSRPVRAADECLTAAYDLTTVKLEECCQRHNSYR